MSKTYKIPVSVKGIVFENGKVWLRKNERNEWELPGGKMDKCEQPIKTVVREMKEELGLKVQPSDIIQSHLYKIKKSKDEKKGVLVISYLCEIVKRVGEVEHEGEAGKAEFKQFPINKIHNLKMPTLYKNAILKAYDRLHQTVKLTSFETTIYKKEKEDIPPIVEMDIKGFEDTIKWYDRNAIRYAQATEKHAADYQIEEFCDLLNPGSLVLDAGCGAGRDTKLLCQKGVVAIGLDLSSGLINIAKSKYPHIEFICGDFLGLEFKDNYFDGIWAHASLVHFETVEEVKQALSEFYRTLKSGGILHILVKSQKGKKKTAIVSDAVSGHEQFFRYFTQKELDKLLIDTGFVILKTEEYKESDKFPDGRENVDWIRVLAEKS